MLDLLICNAVTGRNGRVDTAVAGGKVVKRSPDLGAEAAKVSTPAVVRSPSCSSGHLYLDKVHTLDQAGQQALDLTALEEYRDRVIPRVVSFPQEWIVRAPGAASWVRQAMKRGADLVGGIPWIEYTDPDAQEHLESMLSLAVETLRQRWEGRVTVRHDDISDAYYPFALYRHVCQCDTPTRDSNQNGSDELSFSIQTFWIFLEP